MNLKRTYPVHTWAANKKMDLLRVPYSTIISKTALRSLPIVLFLIPFALANSYFIQYSNVGCVHGMYLSGVAIKSGPCT